MVEDKEFIALLEEQRHKELILLLRKIKDGLGDGANNEILDAINIAKDVLSKLSLNIDNVLKNNSNLTTNMQKDFVLLVGEISEEIKASNTSVINAIENRAMPSSFTLVRGLNGLAESVEVRYKPAKQLI